MTVGELIQVLQQVDPKLPVVILNRIDFDLATRAEVTFGVNVCNENNPRWWFAETTTETPNATTLLWIQ